MTNHYLAYLFSLSHCLFQLFLYLLNLKYELKNTEVGVITATPIVRGSIEQIYLYEEGSGYGSDILNLEKTSTITVKTGKNAELKPIVSDGKISYVEIQSKGQEYSSAPDLDVVGVGTGIGAKLKAVVENGKIENVIILEGGIQYQQDKVNIKVTPCLLYTSPSPRDRQKSRMPSSA